MKVITSRGIKFENHSNLDADAKKALGGIGLAAATAGIGAIASRVGVAKTGLSADVKAACGRKPLFGKAKKAAYAKCASDFANKTSAPAQTAPSYQDVVPAQKSGMSTTMKIGIAVGSALILGIVIVLIVRHNKNKK